MVDCGGFRLALQKQGYSCVFCCDIDKKAQETYKNNFGDTPLGDITEIPKKKNSKHEILCAGFPCQSFSVSGKHGGMNDTRGRLFYEIVRIAKYHKPAIMLLENVKNILSVNNKKVIETIKKEIDDAGYNLFYDVLNSSFFRIPQKRERVYFVCIRKDTNFKYDSIKPSNKKIYLKDILMSNDDCKSLIVKRKDMQYDTKKQPKALKPIRIGHVNKAHQGERIYSINGHSVTLAATTGGAGANTGLYLVNGSIRRLHIEECKQLMGFPKNFKLSVERASYKQLGNAVMPYMIEKIVQAIKK